ncbi:MAG: cobyrinic acid a,c-diamide synthase [Halobacteriaceae archaeon]
MRGVVLAGTASGVGKTVATLAVCRALRDAGHEPRLAKAGPDFIDPTHHAAVAGDPSRTLDTWLQGVEGCRRNYWRGDGDVCVVEGMMGLYDGDACSSASVAAALDLPVVLVVDASAGMESVAATALGFRAYAAEAAVDVEVAGVLAQRCRGGRHARGVREALPDDLAWCGRVPPDEALAIPDRHLGLHTASEAPLDDDALAAAAETVETERLVALARTPPRPDPASTGASTGATVAVARDDAFGFVYPATLERLRARADVRTFSPVAGDPLPDCDAAYLPGGYPERHAAALAESEALATLADRAADGLPVLGECGGLMALGESLVVDGERHAMAGVLPVDVTMTDRPQALDHVELRARRDCPTATAGTTRRGHEFHYSRADPATDASFAFDVARGAGIDGRDGLLEHAALGTYAHVHPASGAFDVLCEGAT